MASSTLKDATALDSGPRAALRTLRLLSHIATFPEGTSLARLSEHADAPKSSLLALLRALAGGGYVLQGGGKYLLGPEAHRLGLALTPATSLTRIARPFMEDLARQAGETVLIALLDRETHRAIYVEKVESANSIRYTVPLGTSRPLYCSAAGRVLLASLPEEEIEAYLWDTDLVPLTPLTVTQAAALRPLLARIREEGVAVTQGEVSTEVSGFAAPLIDEAGRVVAAVAMAAPVSRSTVATCRLKTQIRNAATLISRALGMPQAAVPVPRKRRRPDLHPKGK